MGIQGLLPLLKSIMVPTHIKDFNGSSVAVDTYSWLHKAALSCSLQLCKDIPTTRHIDYCMHRVNLLRHNGVKPVLVFDGGLLPMKTEQENKRAKLRRENLARAKEHESNGNIVAAYECYQKAVDISPSIAYKLIEVLKQENVSYVVAPYEADAQMTFLAVSKQVDAIITEDSDLIPFGCPRIIFKMDKFGQGVEFKYSTLQQNKDLSFTGFTKQMFLEMCILSGCDYLQSLPGMGLKRAHALITKFKSYDKVIKHLRYSTIAVPPLYEESFKKAIWTFRHQRVYDPMTEDIVHLFHLSDDIGDDLDFLGPLLPQDIATGIAKGDLDPFTKMPFQEQNSCAGVMLNETSQLKNPRPDSEKRKLDLPLQKNLLTNYFCFASLQAKRKFMAPRVTSKPSHPMHGLSYSPEEEATEKSAVCETRYSPASLLDCGNFDSGPLSEDSVEDGCAVEVPGNCKPLVHGDSGDVKSNSICAEHALLQQPMVSVQKSFLMPTDLEQSASRAAQGKTDTRKLIVRSPYFQHKFVNENTAGKTEAPSAEDGASTALGECGIQEDDPFEKYRFKGTIIKKRTNACDSENQNRQCVRKSDYPNKRYCTPNLDDASMEPKAVEVKFGSNISHLGHYSEVAEKSMERYVSVISSFKHSPSGSRASGLRAPLKAIHTNRPMVEMDLSKFAFVPNKGTTASASRRT